jgi:hypothetical protein
MADIRINALATTAASTASDDFIAVDGSANGTRKLNAYSPTFGGNLTVSGTGTSSVAGNLALNGATSYLAISPTTAVTNNVALQLSVDVADNRAIRMTNTASGGHAYDFIPGGGGDAGSLGLYDNTAGSYRLFISGTGNATLSGNLTVSGRDLTLGSSESVIYFGTPSANYLYYNGSSLFLRVGSVDRITIPGNTGNFLIGGTIDGGQKLQVSGTAAISSTLSVGSGTNTFGVGGTTNQSTLVLNGGSSNGYGSRLELQRNGSAQSYIGTAGNILGSGDGAQSDTVIYANGSNKVRLYSGNALTLTLDSSQNATFAGNVLVNSTYSLGAAATGNQPYVQSEKTGKTLDLRGGVNGSRVLNNAGTAAVFNLTDGGDATFAGAIAINNTVNTVSPTSPNRTITMVIGGTTYYIHAKTTND